MPEMPEVEIIRQALAELVVGKTIQSVDVRLPRLIKWPLPEVFQQMVMGQTITAVERRGKYLLFRLNGDLLLVVHLRMTGRLIYATPGMKQDTYTRIVFSFTDDTALLYADTRTLGTLYLLKADEVWRIGGLASLGPEPLSAEFTSRYLRSVLSKYRGTVKGLLLNQKLIGGLGNIYVDESLHLAGIHPSRPGNSLSEEDIERLYNQINHVIFEGIQHGGTTFRDYRNSSGQSGSHQHHLHVYGRKNQPCFRCGCFISKTEVAGRGTHYCPSCQPQQCEPKIDNKGRR
ncbi:MAG: mutM [Firmicutes bacterium]|nr:mutM [Bacillota bacterium]